MSETAPAGAVRRRLWVHCVGSAAPALERLAERALVLATGDDAVCVPRPIDPEYLGYLASLGLGPTAANVIIAPPAAGDGDAARPLAERLVTAEDGLARIMRRMGAGRFSLEPYAGTPEVFALAHALERATGRPVPVRAAPPDATALAGRRDLARAHAEKRGVPVADGEVVALPPHGRRWRDLEPLRAAIERQLRCTGRAIVRAAGARHGCRFVVGHGGHDVDEVLRGVGLIAEHRTWLVEVLVEATVCCAVHVTVEPGSGKVGLAGISDRRLGRGLTAAGSRYPSAARTTASMERWAATMGEWLRELGYAGSAAIEFAEHRDPASGQPCARFTGVIPRTAESSYALALKEALATPAFVSGALAARPQGFGRLRETLGGLLYDPDRGTGVLPFAPGALEHGRCPVVALGRDRLHASELLATAQGALDGEPAAARGG